MNDQMIAISEKIRKK